MEITIKVNEKRITGKRSPMIYGHFIEHFHRQIYDGIYDPGHPLADADGFRTENLRLTKRGGWRIQTPLARTNISDSAGRSGQNQPTSGGDLSGKQRR